MNFACENCKRTFSNRSGYRQHVNFCIQSESSSEKSTDINDMSLDSEGFTNFSEVKFLK
jgi:hypothetical protein